MSDIKNLKKIEDLGWEAFRATGDIGAYGMIVSSRELQKEKNRENESNGMSM